MRIYIYPAFRGEDTGDGGVRRVIEAQTKYLPALGHEIVGTAEEADLIALHIADLSGKLLQVQDKPIVVSNHGLYWQGFAWPNWALKANIDCIRALRCADAITAPSEWVAQSLRRNSLRRVTVIGHGIDLEEWPYSEVHKGFALWNKTRRDPVCDPDPAMELARLRPDVSFVSTYGDEYLPNVGLTGRLPYEKAKKVLRDAAVYLCTTKETFGIGTLEAMASGVPVLGWRWGGQAEIIEHEKTGYLAKPEDYEDLERGLDFCLTQRDRIARAARAVVEERYQWRDVVARYAVLYEQTLRDFQRPRPKVSVVVPCYELSEMLSEALDSVKAQTIEDWECVIVDDASPDDTATVARQYRKEDKRFKLVSNPKNLHVSGAVNAGIAKAKGRYILRLDADDRLPARALERLSEALDQDRDLHIAYGNVEFIEPDGSRWHSGWPPAFRPEWQLLRRTKDDRPANLIPTAAMFRREVWELAGGLRRRYRNGEDADFWTRATSYGFRAAMVTQDDCLFYNNRPDSLSHKESPPSDWTMWYPWSRDESLPPAAVASEKAPPVMPYDLPYLAVIIPVGPGHEELVIDALDSVDAQSFRSWECIVANDTGKDLPWLPSWAKEVRTAGLEGVAKARNLAIAAAQAPLFVPLDADDTLEPDALRRMLRVWQDFGGYVYTDFREVWEGQPTKIWEAPEYDAAQLISKGCLHAVTGLYPKDAWQTVGGFNEKLSSWEDWDYQLKMAEIGVCGTRLPLPLFVYRKDKGFRREENYAALERGKADIMSLWGDYFEGRKELMGCRACPGGGGGSVMASAASFDNGRQQALEGNAEDFVVVEYTGAKMGAMTFKGESGTLYRFAALPGERQKYVRRSDLEFFQGRSDFRLNEIAPPEEMAAPV